MAKVLENYQKQIPELDKYTEMFFQKKISEKEHMNKVQKLEEKYPTHMIGDNQEINDCFNYYLVFDPIKQTIADYKKKNKRAILVVCHKWSNTPKFKNALTLLFSTPGLHSSYVGL